MEVGVILAIVICAALGVACWFMWRIRRCLKEIEQSLDQLKTNLELLSDGLTILLYLTIRDNPDLLEKSPDLEKKALEAAKRLGQKQLTTGRLPE